MRVIPPTAGPPIFAALASPGAAFTLVSARIDRDAVWASLCRAADPTRCFAIQLDDPRKGCEATRAGPWCVTFPDGAPPEEARAPLLKAFGALNDEAIWQETGAATEATPRPATEATPTSGPDEAHPTGHPGALAAATILAPILIGLAIGRALRSRRPSRAACPRREPCSPRPTPLAWSSTRPRGSRPARHFARPSRRARSSIAPAVFARDCLR
jgi:hypothetical protein